VADYCPTWQASRFHTSAVDFVVIQILFCYDTWPFRVAKSSMFP
jgi:hypothetical protein